MSQVALLLRIVVALVGAISSRDHGSGQSLSENGCVIVERFVLHSYEGSSISRGNALNVSKPMCLVICEEIYRARSIKSACVKSDDITKCLFISSLQNARRDKSSLVQHLCVQSSKDEGQRKVIADAWDFGVILACTDASNASRTILKFDKFSTLEQVASSDRTSTCNGAFGIIVISIFIVSFSFRNYRRFTVFCPEIAVSPTKRFRLLFVMAFLVAVMVPEAASFQDDFNCDDENVNHQLLLPTQDCNDFGSSTLPCFSNNSSKRVLGQKCRLTFEEKANVCAYASFKFLLRTSLQGRQATVCVFVELSMIGRAQKLLAKRLKSGIIGTGALRKFDVFTTSEKISASHSTLISRISIVLVFPLFLLIVVVSCVRNERLRSGESDFAGSSTKNSKIRRFVLPTRIHQCIVVIAFLLVNIVPKTVSAQNTCSEDCGGFAWLCTSSSCFSESRSLSQLPNSTTWSEAVEFCSREGGSLASFQDEKEVNDFEALSFAFGEYFFGLIRRPTAATGVYSYRWSDGSSLTYARWNQLSTFNEENSCGKLVITPDSTTHWRAQSCSSELNYICKKSKKSSLRDGEVRLVGGFLPSRGSLEIFHDGLWRLVCMSEIIYSALRTAAAACRQLGYGGLLEATSRIGESDSVSIDVKCTSNDEFVSSCDRGYATCHEHVYVFCRSGSAPPFHMRLRNSSVSSRGIVEIRFWDVWRAACLYNRSQAFVQASADTTCKYFGYGGGTATLRSLAGRLSCWLFLCSPPCASAHDFYYKRVVTNLESQYGVEVKCRNSDWNIRLFNGFGGTKRSEGRVEVYFNKTWRVICDSNWNLNDSIVVCRQLGYEEPISAKRRFPVTKNDEIVYTHGRGCEGNETALRDCDLSFKQSSGACQEAVVLCEERKYCPRGFSPYAGYCYSLSPYPTFLTNNRQIVFVEQCGRNLLTISSSHEHAFVLAFLADLESQGELIGDEVWLGLGRNDGNQFKWSNEHLLSYVMWARGEPSADSSRACVAMNTRTGYWRTADCLSNKRSLCKVALVDFEYVQRETSAPPFDNRCGNDEIYYKNACYYLSKDEDKAVSQEHAHRKKCHKRDAHLATFNSLSDYFFIAKESSPFNGSAYWIALSYNDTSRAFTWLHGSPPTFTKWSKDEPAQAKGSCVLFRFDGIDFGWAVANCSTRAGYICKREISGSDRSVEELQEIALGKVYMCRSGWQRLFAHSCVMRLDTLQTWHKSLAECERLSSGQGSLASIHSGHEMNHFSRVLNSNETWIGLNDLDGEGKFSWTDDSPFVYSSWGPSESKKSEFERKKQDCVATTTSFWSSRYCFEEKPSVCLMPAELDTDECYLNSDDCDINAACANTLFSYSCTCKAGFIGNGTTCEDYRECLSCNKNYQECVKRDGAYKCVCRIGWEGNGSYCADINECDLCTNYVCHPQANCTNLAGSFRCTCRSGWRGDGKVCEDFNECSVEGACHQYANCTNTNGSYICTCAIGFTGNGINCTRLEDVTTTEKFLPLGNSNSDLSQSVIIVISVALSFFVSIFLVVVFVVVYVRRKKNRSLMTVVDEWEINPGDIMLLEQIGEGFFGVVRKAYLYGSATKAQKRKVGCDSSGNKNKFVVACKMLKERYLHHDEIDFLEEIKLMKRIGRHPHIVSMLSCVTATKPLFLIVEYCCHGDLLSFLQKRRVEKTKEDEVEVERQKETLSHSLIISLSQKEENDEGEKNEEEDEEGQAKDTLKRGNDYDSVAVDDDDEGSEEVDWKLTPSDLLSFAWQIASGMNYLSGKNLVHRDLACRNVLVGEKKILKVSDFGLTKAVYEDGAYNQRTARRLPFRWMSIEAILHRLFSEKSDVWSFGVVLWEIVTLGCFPYPCMASKDLLFYLRSGNRLECPENCSKELYELMSECWRSEPEMRPSFEMLFMQLGKMLEEETPMKYLNLDSIYMSSFCDLESVADRRLSGSASSEKTDDALDYAPGDEDDVRQRHVISKECSV